jgi:hypothetical protein
VARGPRRAERSGDGCHRSRPDPDGAGRGAPPTGRRGTVRGQAQGSRGHGRAGR